MLDQLVNILKTSPELIPIYLFMFFMVGLVAWEFIKLIVFAIRFGGKDKNKK